MPSSESRQQFSTIAPPLPFRDQSPGAGFLSGKWERGINPHGPEGGPWGKS